MISNEIIKTVVSVIMIGYLAKVMPSLPESIEIMLTMPVFKMLFLGVLLYIQSGDALVSIASVLILFSAVQLLNLLIAEPFEPVDIEEINRDYSDVSDKSNASESINSMMAEIKQKATDVNDFFSETCKCPK